MKVFFSAFGIRRLFYWCQYLLTVWLVIEGVTPQACPGSSNIAVGSGLISSSNYPSNYPDNSLCVWKLTASAGNKIKLTFLNDFRLEYCSSCTCDSVELYDGQDSNARLLGRYCSTTLPVPMFSSGRYMWVRFRSDTHLNYNGFQAQYESVPDNQGCPNSGNLNSTTGTLSSPGYPSSYPGNTNCLWNITAPVGYVIKLVFESFRLEYCSYCTCDYLEFSRSQEFITGRMARYCSTIRPPTMFSTGRVLWIKFATDLAVYNTGFRATYTTLPAAKGCLTLGVIKGTSGYITSPEFPSHYPHNASCQWRIIAPPMHRLIFTFHVFLLESVYNCVSEYVKIMNCDDAGAVTSTAMGKQCGSGPEVKTIVADGRSAYLSFVSDDSVSYKGFNVTYYAKSLNTSEYPSNGLMSTSTSFSNREDSSSGSGYVAIGFIILVLIMIAILVIVGVCITRCWRRIGAMVQRQNISQTRVATLELQMMSTGRTGVAVICASR